MDLTQEQMDFIESVYSDIPEDWDNMYDIYVEVKDICMGEELFYTEDDGMYEIYSELIWDYLQEL